MSIQTEERGSPLDIIRWLVAIALVGSAIVAFYVYSDESTLMRVGGLLASVVLAAGIAWGTTQGQILWGMTNNAYAELRRVIWPTRTETTQTSLVVLALVIAFAIFLWLVDMVLAGAVQRFTGLGG